MVLIFMAALMRELPGRGYSADAPQKRGRREMFKGFRLTEASFGQGGAEDLHLPAT